MSSFTVLPYCYDGLELFLKLDAKYVDLLSWNMVLIENLVLMLEDEDLRYFFSLILKLPKQNDLEISLEDGIPTNVHVTINVLSYIKICLLKIIFPDDIFKTFEVILKPISMFEISYRDFKSICVEFLLFFNSFCAAEVIKEFSRYDSSMLLEMSRISFRFQLYAEAIYFYELVIMMCDDRKDSYPFWINRAYERKSVFANDLHKLSKMSLHSISSFNSDFLQVYDTGSRLVSSDLIPFGFLFIRDFVTSYSTEHELLSNPFILDKFSECVWKLQRWDVLDQTLIESNSSHSSNARIANLLSFNDPKCEFFLMELERFGSNIIDMLSNATCQTLHFEGFSLWSYSLFSFVRKSKSEEFKHIFPKILDLENASVDELLFSFVFSERFFGLESSETINIGLGISRVLRKRGFLNSAIRIVDSLCKSNLKDQKQYYYCSINYEYGKLLWALDKKDDAIVLLEGLFDDDLENVLENGDMAVFQAKIRLQSFKMRYEHGAFEIETLLSRLYESIQLWPNQEKIFCHFSRFLLSLVSDKEIEPENEWVIHAAKSLARGVLCGSKNVQETLPKLLSLWFQYGLVENALFNKIHRIVFKLFEKTTPQKLSLSLSQLVSRICHPREEVFRLLSLMIFSILQSFPQSTLWQLVGVCRSTLPTRSKKCQEILGKCRNDLHLKNILSDMLSISDSFVTLANLNTNPSGLLISREIPSMKRLFPLSIAIPSISCFKYEGSMELPKLVEISDRVDVMNSLQKPKRFTMIGSDGSYHCFLAKSKDDLRKDSRFIEYLGKVKDLLGFIGNDIRPYTVIPLDETCGIIEWVNDTVTYRSILLKLYEERGISVSSKQLKEISALKLPPREIFVNHLLSKFPSVLNEWFFRQFIYPDTWLKSKLAFIFTCGIMSVSGWVVGLGDRHGENLLLDSRLGRVVHVDFSCLFEKGLTLEKPERVPFRLTHNMENVMGPLHFLGLFERICRETLLVMRNNRKMILHGLETFVFDPLVEWTGKASRGLMGEVDSVEARKILAIIDDKIQGLVGSGKSLKLSVQAQVDQLVKDATSVENLSVMYIGWAPFM